MQDSNVVFDVECVVAVSIGDIAAGKPLLF
jgi:hypothetical protein